MGQLWRDEHALPLRPKALAVLRYLASHPARLVRRAELLGEVRPDSVVTPTALEACFQRAIRIAQHQGAKSFELRAGMSLSRLSYQQGKTGKARQLLAEICGWFSEGFETADLQEATALLDEWAEIEDQHVAVQS